MQIPLDRAASEPLYLQITRFIHHQIRLGNLPAGTALPPIRALAKAVGVSKAVVSMAYDELAVAGLVQVRVGAGTVVTAQGMSNPRWLAPDPGPPRDQAGALYDLLRLANRPGGGAARPPGGHRPLSGRPRSGRTARAGAGHRVRAEWHRPDRAQLGDVAFAPGDLFFPGDPPGPYMRLGFGNVTPAQIATGVARLGALLRN